MGSKKFDPTKPVQTVDGRKARILCTDRKGGWPIIALYTYPGDEKTEVAGYFNQQGEHSASHKHNLVNVPAVRHEYLNIVKGIPGSIRWSSEVEADKKLQTMGYSKSRTERLKLTYEDEVLVNVEILPQSVS